MGKSGWLMFGGAVTVAALMSVTVVAFAGDFNFGLGANSNATAKDVGLPFYPGARLAKKDKDEDSAAKVWGSFGFFGMKVVAIELESNDAPGKVAPFYWNAVGHYGPVVDCSAGKPRPPVADAKSNRLDCHDDHPGPGEFVFKAGVKNDFHLAAVEPKGSGSKIALVFIQIQGAD